MLNKARDGKYAVGQFNINNLEWTKSILTVAEELKSPVILGVSEGAGKYMTGFKTIVGMVNGMLEEMKITVPVALHLDHGTFEGAQKCIRAGFSSIMFDGSHYPIAENIEKTKILVNACDVLGISIEAEVGSIGGEEDGVVGLGECADPKECKAIADLGVTMLAAGIGNIHGKYPANWKGLRFDTLAAISEKVGKMPLQILGVEELTRLQGLLLVLIRVEGGDALLGGAVLLVLEALLLQGVQLPVPGQEQGGPVADLQVLRGDGDAGGPDALHLVIKILAVQGHAVAQDVHHALPEDAGGQQVQGECLRPQSR